jgi:hypothetical protein
MNTISRFLISVMVAGGTAGLLPVAAQTAISPAAGSTATVEELAPQGFMMLGGRVFVVRQGQAAPLDGELALRVSPGGITGFDQVARTLAPGQMLTMDGRIVAAPEGLVVAPPPPQIDPAEARILDRGVRGENISGLAPARPAPPAEPVASQRAVTTTTTTTAPAAAATSAAAPLPQPVAPPSASTGVPAPAAGRGTRVPGANGDRFSAPTVFDPGQVNDGSIEAAGTGTRRRAVD